MAWHQKGFTRKEQAYFDLIVSKSMLEIINLQKGDMRARDTFKIIDNISKKVIAAVDVLEENDECKRI